MWHLKRCSCGPPKTHETSFGVLNWGSWPLSSRAAQINNLLQPFSQVKTQATNTIWQSDLFLFFPSSVMDFLSLWSVLKKNISLATVISSPYLHETCFTSSFLNAAPARSNSGVHKFKFSTLLYPKALFSQTNPVLLVKKLREKKTCETWGQR